MEVNVMTLVSINMTIFDIWERPGNIFMCSSKIFVRIFLFSVYKYLPKGTFQQ